MFRRCASLVAACLCLLSACEDDAEGAGGATASVRERDAPAPPPPVKPSDAPTPPKAETTAVRTPPLEAGQEIEVPGGSLKLGSEPTTAFRDHGSEALLVPAEVATFHIDRLPYPNDPDKPLRTGATRTEAAAACAEGGKRLCTEEEWEWACKTPALLPYPTGASLDMAACGEVTSCENPLGVRGLGLRAREWTASDATGGVGHPMRTAVLRGAEAGAPAPAHRCAARSGATADSTAEDIAFRCCRGPMPATGRYPAPRRRKLIEPLDVPIDAMREALKADDKLAPLAASFEPFDGVDIARALARGGRGKGSISAWHIADATFVWTPQSGQTLWVLSGHAGDRSLVALVYPMPDGSFLHAASTIIDEKDMSVALGYTEDKPLQLLWTSCFGCPGEGGDIEVGEDGVVGFAYR